MNITKIKILEKKVKKEADKAVKAIYAKYSKEMNILIANQIPKGHILHNLNGQSIITDKSNNKVKSGKAWGLAVDEQLDYIASFQYNNEHNGSFNIKYKISGKL